MKLKLLKLPILKRIIPSLIKRLNIINKKIYRNKIYYDLDLRYFVDRNFYLYGWDDDIIQYLNLLIKKNKIEYFLDIGSCWGIYTLQVAQENPEIKIYSYDVYNRNIERLNSMLNKNKFNNVKTYNLAIGSERKVEKFAVEEEYSPNYAKDSSGKFKIEVNQDRIDNLIDLKNKNIAIKIDVERMEHHVLKGAMELLRNNNCFIIIETDQKKTEVLSLLNLLAYKKINHNLNTIDSFFSNFNLEEQTLDLT
tara:strand:- start:143 stop:895 length:753 start_codon:yes stop_codon:yes gene_type:complete